MSSITIPPDKALHIIAGALAYLGGACLAHLVGDYPPAAAGITTALGAGIAKELADWLGNRRAMRDGRLAPHTVDGRDVIATLAGGLAMWCAAVVGV